MSSKKMNQYNELAQKSAQLVNALVYYLKSLELSQKRSQSLTLNTINNLNSTFSVD